MTKQLSCCIALQCLDVFTTLIGFHLGAHEANPFIQYGLGSGPYVGLAVGKLLAAVIVYILLCTGRNLLKVNWFFGALVIWNFGVIAVQILRTIRP